MAVTIMDDLLDGLELSETVQQQALAKAKEGYVMALLEVGEITSGRAGKILGVPRLEVLEMMKRWGISLFDDSQILEELALEVDLVKLQMPVFVDESLQQKQAFEALLNQLGTASPAELQAVLDQREVVPPEPDLNPEIIAQFQQRLRDAAKDGNAP